MRRNFHEGEIPTETYLRDGGGVLQNFFELVEYARCSEQLGRPSQSPSSNLRLAVPKLSRSALCTVNQRWEGSINYVNESLNFGGNLRYHTKTWRKPIARVWEMRWLMGGRSALKRTGRGIGCTEIIRNVHERLSWGNSQTSWQIVEIACCGNWIVLNFDQFWNFARFYNFRNAWNWAVLEIEKSWRFRSSTLCCVVFTPIFATKSIPSTKSV